MTKQIDLTVVCKPFVESNRMIIADFTDVPTVPQVNSHIEVPHVDYNGKIMVGRVLNVNHDAMSFWHIFAHKVSLEVIFDEADFDLFWEEVKWRYSSAPPNTNHSVWRPVEND